MRTIERAAAIYHAAAPVAGTPADIRKEIFSRALRMACKAAGVGTPSGILDAAGLDFDKAFFAVSQAHRSAERGVDFMSTWAKLCEVAKAA